MAYSKTNWINGQAPAINAENLNKIETGIEDAHEQISGLEKRTLLWTNPEPATQFAAQTVSLDLSEYDKVEVVTNFSTGAQYGISDIKSCKIGTNMINMEYYTGKIARRRIYTTENGVQFDDASSFNTYGSTASTVTNAALIPVEIYGIKIL